MAAQTSLLDFKVRRYAPKVVAPANPTPREIKLVSDIDDQHALRHHIPIVQFYPYQPSMAGKDPVQVIREALAKTLVFYYPIAGRLREGPNGKLMVDCNEEGVLFIEADADVTIEHFGDNFKLSFPCFHKLLYNVPDSDGIIDCPLMLLQVTRLKCGGFIFAIRVNHIMCDASGLGQFLNALAEIARGAPKPSILPVWCREILCARNPPRVTCIHNEYQQLPPDSRSICRTSVHSFFVGPKEIASIRAHLPRHLATNTTSFEVLTAWLWCCYTTSLEFRNPNKEVTLSCVVNARFGYCKFNPPLPEGFYGNAMVFPAVVTTVKKHVGCPLEDALELVKKVKNEANEEYVHSAVDFMADKQRSCYLRLGTFLVSDLTKTEFTNVNFGWGKALYSGMTKASCGNIPGVTFYNPYTNSKGEQGRMVLICVPKYAMKRLKKELGSIYAH